MQIDETNGDEKKPLDVEPTSTTGASGSGPASASPEGAGPKPGYGVEDEPVPASVAPRTADAVCPNCGAERPEGEELLCLRCGFNMVTLKVEKTATGQVLEEEPEEDGASRVPPLCRAGRGNLGLPLGVAGACAAIMLLGCLMGNGGLFADSVLKVSEDGSVSIPFGARLAGIGRYVVLVIAWAGAGVTGLMGLAAVNDARLGDLRLAAVRVLAIVAAMRIATFVGLDSAGAEWLAEFPLQAFIFVGGSMVLFELKPRDAAIHGIFTLASFLALWVVSWALNWAA